ncbi:MAG: peptidoglycan DD-metalloendopeptidase family protein [Candidatus Desulfofervidaceae bacterium]|nr:peptidoglycan DD-metalloendopeptidase family protein [Candidatus Desulfofervidaceae bacterium]
MQIKTVKKKFILKQREEERISQEIKQIEQRLKTLNQKQREIEASINHLNQELMNLKEQKIRIETSLDLVKKQLTQRLIAIYQWHRLGLLSMLSPTGLKNAFLTSTYLGQLVKQDQALLNKYQILKENFDNLENARKEKLAKVERYQLQIKDLKTQIEREKRKKIALLHQAKQAKERYRRKAIELKRAAARLEKIIKNLKKQQIKKQQIKAGHLPWPVKGKIIVPFGKYYNEDTSTYLLSNGIEIKVPAGTPFKAVASGKVVYADWLKGYGNIIILDHGNGYYTLYAHAISLYKKKGSWVKAGEVLGKVGEMGSINGPTLYFELRHHTKPIDPFTWLRPNK